VRQIVDWLSEPETKRKGPLRIAARAHYDLLRVFPFQNDSGKVARLFMNLLLYRAGYPPAIVHATERQRYYDGLKGEPNTILRIVQESVENGLASVERMLDERDAKARGPLT
jgi:Fic family protein